MSVSRRSFVTSLGAGGVGLLVSPNITWRGREAAYAYGLPQGVSERRADRLIATAPGMIRIDSNENPNGPGPHVLEVIGKHLNESNRYPILAEDALIDAIAKAQGVKPENIILGCGSGEVLRAAVHAFTSPTKALVSPDPTFEAPANFAKFLGTPVVSPKVNERLELDLDAMRDASKSAGLVYLCNSNNPTATVHSKSDVVAFVDAVSKASPDCVVLVDEAYHEYVENPAYGTVIPLAVNNPRVVVARTFSKVFGMAGLRAGYLVGHPDTLKKASSWVMGSNISALTLAAATAAIADDMHVAEEKRKNREARAFARAFFEKAGYKVQAAEANFFMVDIKRDAKEFKMACAAKKVAIGRKFPSLPTHARISVGTMPEMKKAVEVFKSVLASTATESRQRQR
jgi:histidinol-phosphate aminotransferase